MTSAYEKLFSIKDKVILITGAGGILGTRLCQALAELGAKLVVVDINQDNLTNLCNQLKNIAPHFIDIACDISKQQDVEAMVETTLKKFSRIDILYNNAATKTNNLDAFFADVENFELSTWQEIMATNLDGMFLVAKYVGKQMIRQQSGNIIQTTSIYGHMAPDQRIYENSNYMGKQINTPAVYSASKAGVIGLTRHLATLWAQHGIRVNCISPGGITSGQNDEFQRRYSQRVPLGRMAAVDDMIGAYVFLASDASAYITGQNILVDGGLSAW